MKIKITFSYDGSKFCGFQRQNNERTVQKEIENALKNIYGYEIEIKGSGRTDAKVHAYNQVAHFVVNSKIRNLKNKLNNLVNPDIVIKNIKIVSDDFHARSDVKRKKYIYKINLGPYQAALNDYYYQPRYKLDLQLMKEAAKIFLGTHDFHNFVAGQRDDYHTTIISINFKERFQKLEIEFIGTGFYRYMVRNLMGALLEVGKCKASYATVENMLYNPDIPKNLPTAPAEGLYLAKIWYK